MGRWVLCLIPIGLLATAAYAEVEVQVSDERVDVTATAAPLADVLDRLAQQIGMEIVYDGTPPRQRVTLALAGRSPAEAVQGILEGQGLNYALVADPSGKGVKTLLLAGPAGKGTGPASPARPAAPATRRPLMPPGAGPDMMGPDFQEMDEEEPFDEQFLDEEDPEPDLDQVGEQPPAFPAVPEPLAPASDPRMLPFPGGQPQVYPASPFTPQPFTPPPTGRPEPETEAPPQ